MTNEVTMDYKISILSGDGVGRQLAQSAVDILSAVGLRFSHEFKYFYPLIGGVAIEHTGIGLPQDTIDLCAKSDAILLGACGGAKWMDPYGFDTAKKSVMQLMYALNLFLEVTPIVLSSHLKNLSPLKNKLLKDNTVFIIKESRAGTLRGEHGLRTTKYGEQAYSTETITIQEIERIAKSAYELARFKKLPIVSVDMADKTENGKLWRKIVSKISNAYPETKTTHMLIDECLFELNNNAEFGIVLTSNLLGQIVTAHTASLTGAVGSIATANIGIQSGLYSAYYTNPDSKTPNPIGTILSTALLLSQSCKLSTEAQAVERSVQKVLQSHFPESLGGNVSSTKFTELVSLEILNYKDN